MKIYTFTNAKTMEAKREQIKDRPNYWTFVGKRKHSTN